MLKIHDLIRFYLLFNIYWGHMVNYLSFPNQQFLILKVMNIDHNKCEYM